MKIQTLTLAAGLLALSFASSNAMPLCGVGQICKLQPVQPHFQVDPGVLKPIKTPPVILPVKPLPIGPLPVPPKPVDNGPSFGINVNVGGGYDSAYGGDYVSCHEAKQIVREHGYKKVRTQDCSGDDYSFLAKRHGQAWIVQVSDTGDIVGVDLAD